jgi:mono/diheme cytochrome c family protein
MKLRLTVLVAALLLLAACSMAEDITPPPDYSAPATVPVEGVVFPSALPSTENGAALYAVHCASCHGDTGLGNGPMADQAPVAVPAIGLRDISSQAVPTDWYTVVSQGNPSRGMPAYSGLPESDRWDVVAYMYTLSTSADQIQTGAALFAENCAQCHGVGGNANPVADFTDPAFIVQRTGTGMARQVAEGGDDMPAFGSLLTEDQIFALTDYIRSLSFGQPVTVAAVDSVQTTEPTPTSEPVAASSDSTTLAVDASPTATPEPALLTFSGTVTTGSESALATGLTADLHQYDMNAGAELDTVTANVTPDGKFQFNDIAGLVGSQTAYWVTVTYQGVPYSSDFATFDGLTTAFDLPVTVYDSSSDYTLLSITQVDVYFLFDTAGVVQIYELYQIANPGTTTVVFPIPENTIPFIRTPEGAENVQFSPGGTSAPFLSAADGVACPPGADLVYEIMTVFTLPYDKRLKLDIPFALPAAKVDVFVEDGIKVKSKVLDEIGPQVFEQINFVQYETTDVPADGNVNLTISGSTVASGTTTPALDQRLIIGLGIAGLLLVAAGIFLFVRERNRTSDDEDGLDDEEEGEDSLGKDPQAIMDAIIALDDEFKVGEISKEAYEKRREELKERLKELTD